ncbi:MAG: hypothetical protein ACRELY_17680 [Polyangiaceae bacterium]
MRRVRFAYYTFLLLGFASGLLGIGCSTSPEDPADRGAWDAAEVDASDGSFINYGYDLDATDENPVYADIRFKNDRCFPNAIATDYAGLIACRILVLLSPSRSCAEVGFAAAPKPDVDYLEAYYSANGVPLPAGTFCSLDQIAGAGCFGDAGPGWCYVHGACTADASCSQAICSSSSYDAGEDPMYTWLTCP